MQEDGAKEAAYHDFQVLRWEVIILTSLTVHNLDPEEGEKEHLTQEQEYPLAKHALFCSQVFVVPLLAAKRSLELFKALQRWDCTLSVIDCLCFLSYKFACLSDLLVIRRYHNALDFVG